MLTQEESEFLPAEVVPQMLPAEVARQLQPASSTPLVEFQLERVRLSEPVQVS